LNVWKRQVRRGIPLQLRKGICGLKITLGGVERRVQKKKNRLGEAGAGKGVKGGGRNEKLQKRNTWSGGESKTVHRGRRLWGPESIFGFGGGAGGKRTC